jgi:hypothetical protein
MEETDLKPSIDTLKMSLDTMAKSPSSKSCQMPRETNF